MYAFSQLLVHPIRSLLQMLKDLFQQHDRSIKKSIWMPGDYAHPYQGLIGQSHNFSGLPKKRKEDD